MEGGGPILSEKTAERGEPNGARVAEIHTQRRRTVIVKMLNGENQRVKSTDPERRNYTAESTDESVKNGQRYLARQ